jgi:microcystin-dependent protein
MSDPFLGEVRLFAGNFAPIGWALCNGQLLSIQQNTALFALLGTTYGGNGQTTFALPDYRGRVPIGMGQGPGLSNVNIGEVSGQETVTLTANQIPSHDHDWMVVGTANNAGQEKGGTSASALGSGSLVYSTGATSTTLDPATVQPAPTAPTAGHENMAPYLAINFIMALEGIFPSRN